MLSLADIIFGIGEVVGSRDFETSGTQFTHTQLPPSKAWLGLNSKSSTLSEEHKEESGDIVKEADDSLAKDYKPARCFRFLDLVHVRYKEIQHTFPSEDVYFTENGEYRRCLKSGWTRCTG